MGNRLKKQKYSIFVVDDKDWMDLNKDMKYMTPEKLKGALGFANPETMEAYVRKTGVAEIDDITMEHELEELLATVSPHEVDGIRYKFLDDVSKAINKAIIQPINSVLSPVLDPVLKATGISGVGVSGGTNGTQVSLGGTGVPSDIGYNTYKAPVDTARGAGNIDELLGKTSVTSTTPLTTAFNQSQAQQFGSPVTLGGQTSAVSSSGGSLTSTPLASGFNFSTLPSLNLLGNTSTKSATTTTPANTTPKPVNTLVDLGVQEKAPALGGLTLPNGGMTPGQITPGSISPVPNINVIQPGSLVGNGNKTEPAQTWGSKLGKATEKFLTNPQNLLGLGSALLSTMQKTPTYQEPASVEQIRSQLLSGTSPTQLGTLAKGELSKILSSSATDLYPVQSDAYYQAALRRTQDSYAEAKKNLDAQYNQAGVYGSGEHLAAVDKLNQQLTNAEADLYAQTEATNRQLAMTAKQQAIQDSLGVDKATMDDLVGLTGLDVNVAAQKYGADVADVIAIRNALAGAGTELIKSGMQQGSTQQTVKGKG